MIYITRYSTYHTSNIYRRYYRE